ncbi:MAG TPA: 5'/3'-nucleotidase SurE [Acidimicrobiales bacterium]|nr:5'/3'-nucleotidase SurE [Acidimicrobiales bacterium]
MRILVTNDDGIDSEGLRVLAIAMRKFGDVTVIAPDDEYSGASAALGALHRIQPEVHETTLDGIEDVWAVTGPPALCVTFARLGAFGPPFDMVVAGINPGVNVGRSVYHSGTVGAALTARNAGMHGVAVSQAVHGFGIEGQGWDEMLRDQRWDGAAAVASAVVDSLVSDPPPAPVVVNVNVPNSDVEAMRGWQRTSIGRIPPRVIAEARLEPKVGHPGSFRIAMKWGDAVSLPEGTDGGAIERDLVSVSLLGSLSDPPGSHAVDADEHAMSGISRSLDELFAEFLRAG